MSVNLDQVVNSLVETAPSGELSQVSADLSTILHVNQSTINNSIQNQIDQKGSIISGKLIASKWNKQPGSTKYIDYVNNQLFNVDYVSRTAIDIEEYRADITYPLYFDDLVTKLQAYGQDHYPSEFAFCVIPGDEPQIMIIGEKVSPGNFYTGSWNSHYHIRNGVVEGVVTIDVHYYEDGNVRLNFEEKVSESIGGLDDIVNAINKIDTDLSLKLVHSFNELNEKTFKGLRRLLPVTRSKVNWGSAIGNYRLGSDVVNKK
jgi:capping protein alpha